MEVAKEAVCKIRVMSKRWCKRNNLEHVQEDAYGFRYRGRWYCLLDFVVNDDQTIEFVETFFSKVVIDDVDTVNDIVKVHMEYC